MQMEDFRDGGEGVAYHDLDAANKGNEYRLTEGVDIQPCALGGYNLCYGEPTEWLEYSINVPVSGLYSFDFYVASPTNDIKFYLDYGGKVSSTVTVPNTGGWQAYQAGGLVLNLTAGIQNIRFNIVAGGNLDKAVIKRVLGLSHDATLSNISVGGVNVAGFSPSVMSYQVSAPYFYPPIVATQTEGTATYQTTFSNNVATIVVTAGDGTTQMTYTVTLLPITLPSTIGQTVTLEMENFNSTEGIGYHDSDVANKGAQYRPSEGVDIQPCALGGYNLCYGEPTEWLVYSINVPVSGVYSFDFYVASAANDIKFYVDYAGGSSSTVTVPNTGDWQTWQKGNISLNLTAGIQTIKFNFVAGGNLDKAIITLDNTTSLGNFSDNLNKCNIYPNPASNVLNVSGVENANLSVFTIDGKALSSIFSRTNNTSLDISKLKHGTYIIKIEKDNQITNSRFIVK
jgi:hypothetical protein